MGNCYRIGRRSCARVVSATCGSTRPTPSLDAAALRAAPHQIARRAAAGDLPAGTKLPTVRALATELGLAANTVARAYRELEADGVVVTEGRRGTFVASATAAASSEAAAAAATYAPSARRLGLTRAEATRLRLGLAGLTTAQPALAPRPARPARRSLPGSGAWSRCRTRSPARAAGGRRAPRRRA